MTVSAELLKQQLMQWCWDVVDQTELNDQLETIWKQEVVAKFEGTFRSLPGGTDRNHELQSGQLVSQTKA
jgi:hypothetical protein